MEPRSEQSSTIPGTPGAVGAAPDLQRLLHHFWGTVLAGGGPAVLYVAAVSIAAQLDRLPFDTVLCFHPDRTPGAPAPRQAAAALSVTAATVFLFVAPGILGTIAIARRFAACRTAHVASLCANTAALMLLYLMLRGTVGVGRTSFCAGWTAWTLVLAWIVTRGGWSWEGIAGAVHRGVLPAAIGLALALASIVGLFPEQFLQCFNEDGAEAHELARSLRTALLPMWEIETGELEDGVRYGTVVVNPSLINSYWTSAVQVLLGDTELSARLPYWVWWLGIYGMCLRLIRLARSMPIGNQPADAVGDHWLDCVLVGLLAVLVSVLFSLYVGYNPYMADLANPGVTNALFTLCYLAMLESLFHRDGRALIASILLGSLVLYSGVVMLVLMVAAAWWWQPISRRQACRWGGISAALLVGIGLGYALQGAREGVLGLWVDAWDVEYVNDYLAPVPRWQSAPLFLGYFVLGCGGVASWGMVRGLQQGAWQRTVATASGGYLAIVLLSGFKNLHYLGPLLPIPLILLLGSIPVKAVGWRVAAGGSLLLCMGLAWPAERSTFVLNRHLGQQTTFATDSYAEAVQWARLRYGLQAGQILSWDCDQHSWVAYAQLDRRLSHPRPLLVSPFPPPSTEYRLLALGVPDGASRSVALYARDPHLVDWMASQRPLRPLERYPWIMRPLADGPFSPHNNQLDDVHRMRAEQRRKGPVHRPFLRAAVAMVPIQSLSDCPICLGTARDHVPWIFQGARKWPDII